MVKDLFLRGKPAEILVLLKKGKDPKYTTQLSKGVDCTYSHTIKILDEFERFGLVKFEKAGRIKIVRLTEKGFDIAHDLEGLIRKFERIKAMEKVAPKQASEKEKEEQKT